jgi:hypothetical protein
VLPLNLQCQSGHGICTLNIFITPLLHVGACTGIYGAVWVRVMSLITTINPHGPVAYDMARFKGGLESHCVSVGCSAVDVRACVAATLIINSQLLRTPFQLLDYGARCVRRSTMRCQRRVQ